MALDMETDLTTSVSIVISIVISIGQITYSDVNMPQRVNSAPLKRRMLSVLLHIVF